jgi:thiamine biosynthesis protein ThiS
VQIKLNGDPFTVDRTMTIAALLAHLDIDPRLVAVERNFAIVKRDLYTTTEIAEGDQIEIVNFVGGGAPDWAAGEARRRLGDQETRRNNRKNL